MLPFHDQQGTGGGCDGLGRAGTARGSRACRGTVPWRGSPFQNRAAASAAPVARGDPLQRRRLQCRGHTCAR